MARLAERRTAAEERAEYEQPAPKLWEEYQLTARRRAGAVR